MYDSQSLLLTLQKAGGQASAEVTVATNFVTFLVLWKVKKFREAQTYIQLCVRTVNELLTSIEKPRISPSNRLNLLGIVIMSLSAVHLKVTSDLSSAQHSVQECLRQLADYDLPVKQLLTRFGKELQLHFESNTASRASAFEFNPDGQMDTPKYSFPEIPSEYFRRNMRSNGGFEKDWLVTAEFDVLFFITIVQPFMSPSTPLIRSSELEAARDRQRYVRDSSSRRSNTSRGRSKEDSYVKLMQAVMSKSRDSRRTASVRRKPPSITPTDFLPRTSVRSSRSRHSREALDLISLTPPKKPYLDQHLHKVREESRDMEEDEMNRTAPMRHDRGTAGERRFGSVPPVVRKQVYLSPSLDTTRPRRRPRRTPSRTTDTLLMIELGQGSPLPLIPPTHKPRPPALAPIIPALIPQSRNLSRRRIPSTRLNQSTSSKPKGHSRKIDSFVLLDISLHEESAEEPKVNM